MRRAPWLIAFIACSTAMLCRAGRRAKPAPLMQAGQGSLAASRRALPSGTTGGSLGANM